MVRDLMQEACEKTIGSLVTLPTALKICLNEVSSKLARK